MAEFAGIKFDWYQTEAQVVITVLKKNQQIEECRVDFSNSEDGDGAKSIHEVKVFAKDELVFCTKLRGSVDEQKATIQCTPSKIEVRLAKSVAGRWETLSVEEVQENKHSVTDKEVVGEEKEEEQPMVRKAKVQPNWEQMGREAEEEELQDSDPSTRLFKKIYNGADDDTRKAMLKSMQESNGTVLNTNWEDVKKKKIVPHKSKEEEDEEDEEEKKA